ncbi:MAG TPA: hypothetical protein VE402_01990 [Candidatus Angelobacter sp.]|nr:hypothetical protein [Candidatus Angelobacter sp.]
MRRLPTITRGPAASILAPLAVLAALSMAAPAAGAGYGNEGEPAFGISGYFKTPPKLNESSTLLVRIWGEDSYDVPITSTARLSIPDGIEVLLGDTVSVNYVAWHARHRKPERLLLLTIRPKSYGSYVIHGSLSIQGGLDYGRDETDFDLPFTLSPDSATYARAPRATRFEIVRNGQRYRYSGRYLVPIDSTQGLLEEEITSKPKPLVQTAAACHVCPGPLPAMVPFVVMVGSDGTVRESRFLDISEEGTIDPTLIAAAGGSLKSWQFEPARAGSLAVADYVVVRVPVKDGSP